MIDRRGWAVLLVAGMTAQGLNAEGFRLYGMSAEGQMRGEALVASAEGPDANWYNPAALSRMKGNTVMAGGLNFLVVQADYTNLAGVKSKNKDENFPLPSAYFAHKWGDRWAFGLGLNTPFGLSTRYDDTVPFKYITTGGKVELINLSPNASWAATNNLSLGLGLNYYRSTVELRKVAPYSFLGGGLEDSNVSLKGEGDGVGVNTGVLWTVSPTQRVGVTYKSEVTIDYDGDKAKVDNAVGTGPYETGVKTRIRYPDMVGFGWSVAPSRKWNVELGGQWTNWADVKNVDIQFDQPQAYLPNEKSSFDWKNTWTFRVGGGYHCTEEWNLQGGYFYTTSPTRESTYTPLVPDGNHHVISLGGLFDNGTFSVGVPGVVIVQTGSSSMGNDVADSTTTQNVDGKYSLFAYQVGLSAGWKF